MPGVMTLMSDLRQHAFEPLPGLKKNSFHLACEKQGSTSSLK
jgi:hypothetical protein